MTINEGLNLKIKATVKLEKYADNVSKEDIEKGLAQPIEVIEYEEDL